MQELLLFLLFVLIPCLITSATKETTLSLKNADVTRNLLSLSFRLTWLHPPRMSSHIRTDGPPLVTSTYIR